MPEISVVSVGRYNRFNHPSPGLINIFRRNRDIDIQDRFARCCGNQNRWGKYMGEY